MNRLSQWFHSSPVLASSAIFFFVLMCLLLLAWRKDINYITYGKNKCPPEHMRKWWIFNATRILMVVSSLLSIFGDCR